MHSKVLYLHVGADKTGSSYIQSLLSHNSSILECRGYFYPEPRGRGKDIASLYDHHLIAAYFSNDPRSLDFYTERDSSLSNEDIKKEAVLYMSYIEESLKKGGFNNMVLSYEGLNALSETELFSLKEYFLKFFDDIKVIYYLKPHLSYAVSAMSQRVRFGKGSWVVHPPVNLYYSKILKLANVFGKSNLLIKKFASYEFLNESLAEDFCSIINFEYFHEFSQDYIYSRNNSLSDLAIRLGDTIHYYLSDEKSLKGVDIYSVFSEYLENLQGPPYQLSNLEKLVIKNAVSADSALLMSDYGIDLLGNDFKRVPGNIISSLSSHPITQVSDTVLDTLARFLIKQKFPNIVWNKPNYKSNVEQCFSKVKGNIEFDTLCYDSDSQLLALSFTISNISVIDWSGRVLPFQAAVKVNGKGIDQEVRQPFPGGGLTAGSTIKFNFSIPVSLDNGCFQLTIAAVQDHVAWLHRRGLKDVGLKLIAKNGQVEVQ